MATEKKSFWSKLLVWVGCFQIVEIVEYVKTEYSALDSAVKGKSTPSILSYIFSLLKDIVAAYKEVQATQLPAAKGAVSESAKSVKSAKNAVKNKMLKTIVK